MSLRAMVRPGPARRTPVERAMDTVGRMAADVRGQVGNLDTPGRVADLDIPGKVIEARRELAVRIDPGLPRRRRRRRVLWIGLAAAVAGGAYVTLARRGSKEPVLTTETAPAAAPISGVPSEPHPVGSPPR
jgi:hypothetical protein